ncbi:cell division protein FtsZ [Methylobacterium sp. CG08_land_8_20_14_0_20_71_15]|uniref:cell division protein FtsZ n=1 Tax=Methylobacterium sp. CG08_land_8_20_14_0_20_71_15 TaxID=1975531 RepID=UPI00257A1335|nr:cell division protein FtsZ [Methylobacterium sp. CG08_land_8_20_14_0_20_71_15]
MAISLQAPDIRELKPRITVFGVGGAGGNAVNNMIESGLLGCEFVVANTDAQALTSSKAERVIQMGLGVTQGLGAGSHPEVGSAAAEEVIDEIRDQLSGAHMCFITAGMGGGTGTGAAPVIARAARDMGILTVGVVTKPFQFEGVRRMRTAEAGIQELQAAVDTLIVIPNQNLFRVANEKTTFADAFAMADQVLYSGVACITDLMVKEGLINLDFADVRAIMRGMGKAMMGTGEASGEKRANRAAEAAIANPLLDDVSMKGARGLLISITGGADLTLYELDEAATRIREEVDGDANIILGATFDESLDGIIRVSVVATGIEPALIAANSPNNPAVAETEQRIAEVAERLRAEGLASDVTRIDDFPVLKELLGRDTEFKRHYLKEGGFVVTDFTILDDVLKEINRKLHELERPGRIIFVEFARDKYARALENFDREVLGHSLILYIYCPFDVCVERNIRRFRGAKGKTPDDHISPSDIMERYYRHDDYEALFLKSEEELKRQAPAPLVVVRNDAEGLEILEQGLEKVVKVFKI